MAAPTHSPPKPSSLMGESTTRLSPNAASSPLDTL